MSPILVRPIREQLEHDRVIRLLQARYKRRFTVGVNLGSEETAPIGSGADAQFPDLVLSSPGSGRKLLGVVEVETSESVNQLEAMAQWARFGRLPVEFALYVPAASAGVARHLCADHQIGVTEIWIYHTLGDQVRFSQVHRAPVEEKRAAARAAAAEAKRAGAASSAKLAGPSKPVPTKRIKSRPKAAAVRKAARKAAVSGRPKRTLRRAGSSAVRKKQ